MSELGGVIILTDFQGLSTSSRKPVDNPAALGASQNMRRGNGGGGIPIVQPPPSLITFETY
jgi:hypothetical protein